MKEINCNVSNCVYNKDSKKCMAGHIEVGTNNANSKDETRCSTFKSASSESCCNNKTF
ncbi:MAG: DUF1540 domain-containing protein [Clostridia bacterium]|nr:DUF1540 domain-containing protein [Clostridia bacterium]